MIFDELEKRSRPAVDHDQRHRVRLRAIASARSGCQAVDLRRELRQLVEARAPGPASRSDRASRPSAAADRRGRCRSSSPRPTAHRETGPVPGAASDRSGPRPAPELEREQSRPAAPRRERQRAARNVKGNTHQQGTPAMWPACPILPLEIPPEAELDDPALDDRRRPQPRAAVHAGVAACSGPAPHPS